MDGKKKASILLLFYPKLFTTLSPAKAMIHNNKDTRSQLSRGRQQGEDFSKLRQYRFVCKLKTLREELCFGKNIKKTRGCTFPPKPNVKMKHAPRRNWHLGRRNGHPHLFLTFAKTQKSLEKAFITAQQNKQKGKLEKKKRESEVISSPINRKY